MNHAWPTRRVTNENMAIPDAPYTLRRPRATQVAGPGTRAMVAALAALIAAVLAILLNL